MGQRGRVWACLLAAGTWLVPAWGAVPDWARVTIDRSPQWQGVLARCEETAAAYGDVDGDGLDEVVLGFKEKGAQPKTRGGLMVFASRHGRMVKVFGGVWQDVYPREIRIETKGLEVLTVRVLAAGEVHAKQTLAYGRDLAWGAKDEVSVEASSTLSAARAHTRPEAVLDGELKTGWAESAMGTGVGEWIRFAFAKPRDIAWVGIAGGDNEDRKAWAKTNRVCRAEIVVRTPEDEGDPEAGVSYAAMGLAFEGEKVQVSLPDRMGITYVPVDRRSVRSLEVRITSVYLGDALDDAWIAEVDFLEGLPAPPDPDFVVTPRQGT